ncbi:OmpA family protein [Flavobacterium filum]|mgnify:CR=1 FL=1|uniref:OmpA/MotB family protein n=1 Tax=Flavobacterium filum TaxID=370974 RepID=UPI0023F36C31|nr:OmpA family protein [Flavobacterium filum]
MSKKESFWIPYADLMTVLMVIFLFISLAYMGLVQFQKKEQDKIFEEYKLTKENLLKELQQTFEKDKERWNLELDEDLSIKFTNPQVLFDEGKSDVTPTFQNILKEFLPKYLSVVMQDKYKDKIAEIRIEGHTNTKPINKTNDPYIDNMELSQNRARNVLGFLRQQECFFQLETSKKERLQYWLTANGLSYGRTIDSNSNLTFNFNTEIDPNKSRRVEFRIVTTSEILVEKIIEQLNK